MFILTYTFVMRSLNISFDETLEKDPFQEYTGFTNWFFPFFMYSLRQSMGDIKVDTFKQEATLIMLVTWTVWFILVVVNSMIFINFITGAIEKVWMELTEQKDEQAYQKKVQILRDLDILFGDKLDPLSTNILLTRQVKVCNERDDSDSAF